MSGMSMPGAWTVCLFCTHRRGWHCFCYSVLIFKPSCMPWSKIGSFSRWDSDTVCMCSFWHQRKNPRRKLSSSAKAREQGGSLQSQSLPTKVKKLLRDNEPVRGYSFLCVCPVTWQVRVELLWRCYLPLLSFESKRMPWPASCKNSSSGLFSPN